MPKTSAFPLRLPEAERERAQKLAAALGYSEIVSMRNSFMKDC